MTQVTSSKREEKAYNPRVSRTLPRWIPKRWYVHVFLWIACFIIGLPLIYAALVSTQTNANVFAYQFYPGSAFGQNWEQVVYNANIGKYMVNSIVIATVITIGKTLLSLGAGLVFVYFSFPGKWIIFGFVLMTLMMPTEILIIALFRFVSSLGWAKTYLALIVPFLASATGTFLFRQHFANIPAELSEAAQLDGATPLQFLFRVLVPISWNTIGALAVIQFIYVWNMYLWPVLMTQGTDLQPIQVGLRSLRTGDGIINYPPLMLGAVLASIPPIVVFILLQRQFMSGFALNTDK